MILSSAGCSLISSYGMWQKLDDLERRGSAFRDGETLNFDQPNKNPHIVPQSVLVVGGVLAFACVICIFLVCVFLLTSFLFFSLSQRFPPFHCFTLTRQ